MILPSSATSRRWIFRRNVPRAICAIAAAYQLTVWLLAAGMVTSLLRGLHRVKDKIDEALANA